MERLYKCFLELLNIYLKTDDKEIKKLYALDISLIYILLEKELNENDNFIEIKNILLNDSLIVDSIKKQLNISTEVTEIDELIDKLKQLNRFINDDLDHYKFLMNKIKIPTIYNAKPIRSDNGKFLKRYVKTDDKFYKFYLDNKDNFYYDDNFRNILSISLHSNNKTLFIMNLNILI